MNPVCVTLILMETVLLFRINWSNGYEPNLLPVPDMTALVTLRDKPLGGNDSMPMVHVRCREIACNPSIEFTLTSEKFCKKMSSCIAVKINQQDFPLKPSITYSGGIIMAKNDLYTGIINH